MIDKSLFFGMQNFLFVEGDETDSEYNYYGFQDKKGAVLIVRLSKDSSSARYYIEAGDFTSIFADRYNKEYKTPVELEDPKI